MVKVCVLKFLMGGGKTQYALYNLDLKYSSFSGKLMTDYIDNITSDKEWNRTKEKKCTKIFS